MISNGFFNNRNLVKKSPVVMVKTFIVLQMSAVAVFFLAAVLGDYGEIYEHLPLSQSLSFHIVEAVGIFTFETILIFYIFFSWYKEYYDIKNDRIVYGRGLIFRKKRVVSLGAISSINYRQGPLGRLTKYGDIELEDKISGKNFIMDHIPEPQDYVEFLVHLKDNIGFKDFKKDKRSLADLLSRGEEERLEFKTSFRWDERQNKVNKALERAVMKTVVSFLNSEGGQLLIGINDSGNVVGLENDYRSLPKPNADGFQNHFNNVFHSMIGSEYRQFIELNIDKTDNQDYCLVRVLYSDKPAYLKIDNDEEFYIRIGNGTTSLKLSETASYIDSHWRGKL